MCTECKWTPSIVKQSTTYIYVWVVHKDEVEFILKEKLGGRQLTGWSRQKWEEDCYPESKSGGLQQAATSSKRGLFFLSAVCLGQLWKAALFLSAQDTHRAPLYKNQRDLETEKIRGFNKLLELLMNFSFWGFVSVSWYSFCIESCPGFCYCIFDSKRRA